MSNGQTLSAEIERILSHAPSGASLYLMGRLVESSSRTHRLVSALSELQRAERVTCRHTFWHNSEAIQSRTAPDGSNARAVKLPDQAGPPVIGNPILIGPVWEPAFAQALWTAGLKIIQQYPAKGYFLDIALVSEDRACLLNVEVDGRSTHCGRRGRRKIKDVIRDATLQQAGWYVKRFWVRELMEDMDSCVRQVEQLWREIMTKRGVQNG